MAIFYIPVGVQTAVYVGDADDVQPLKKILAQRTAGIRISDNVPRNYVPSTNTQEQAGIRKVTLQLTFLAEDPVVAKMAKGISVYGDPNDPPGNTKYSIFIMYPDKRYAKSFWFPELQIVSPANINYNKDSPTIMPLVLEANNRDLSYDLIFRDKYPNFNNSYLYPTFQQTSPIKFV